MLAAAASAGADVVIGVVETHGREETAALLLTGRQTILPPKRHRNRGGKLGILTSMPPSPGVRADFNG